MNPVGGGQLSLFPVVDVMYRRWVVVGSYVEMLNSPQMVVLATRAM